MTGPTVESASKAPTPNASGRYNASGMRVLSTRDRAKVRRLGAKAKTFSINASKPA